MTKRILFIGILIFINVLGKAQEGIHFNTIVDQYLNGLTDRTNTATTIQIRNDTNEDYITWISLDSINEKTDKQLVYEYFFRLNKGDFSLFEILIDEFSPDISIQVGYTFLKRIKPKEEFYYRAISDTEMQSALDRKIILMKADELFNYLKIKINEKYFSKNSELILIE